eukprot:516665_1
MQHSLDIIDYIIYCLINTSDIEHDIDGTEMHLHTTDAAKIIEHLSRKKISNITCFKDQGTECDSFNVIFVNEENICNVFRLPRNKSSSKDIEMEFNIIPLLRNELLSKGI